MRIAHENMPGSAMASTAVQGAEAFAAPADIGFFNAQMANTPVALTNSPGALAERSDQLHALSARVTKGMRDMSLNKHSRQAREITKSLSEAHQQLAVTVKVVNKSVQMVEKLTNLQ